MGGNIFEADEELMNDFISDSSELLDEVENNLVVLFEIIRDTGKIDVDSLNDVFRLFHSIKGSAAFLQLDNLVSLAHNAETLLHLLRTGKIPVHQDHIQLMCESCDLVRQILSAIRCEKSDNSCKDTVAKKIPEFERLIASDNHPAPAPTPSEAVKKTKKKKSSKDEFCKIAAKNLKFLEAAVLVLDQIPDDEESQQETHTGFAKLATEAAAAALEDFSRLCAKAQEVMGMVVNKKILMEPTISEKLIELIETFKDALANIDSEHGKIPDCEILYLQLGHLLPEVAPIKQKQIEKANQASTSPVPSASFTASETAAKKENQKEDADPKNISKLQRQDIRVDLQKLDTLINLVGELVTAEAMVVQNPDLEGQEFPSFEKAARHMRKIIRDLQDVALSVRMVPIGPTFRKMGRLVLDLARKVNKQINFRVVGEETEVDKTIVELLSDPLVHIIRNSADHGFETTQERIAAGKPPAGTLTLEARHEEGEVWIMVRDDGKGLNRDKILKKAIEKGLVREDNKEMTEQEIQRLIFHPGFSTADQVSNISGRGVGMDVVKKNVEMLQGNIDVKSRPGEGTMILLRIPLTLAIIEGMLLQAGRQLYTIPLLSIKETLKAQPSMITTTADGQEILRLREELIPILRLHQIHNLKDCITELTAGILVIVESNRRMYAILVDTILGQQHTVIKPLNVYGKDIKGISGCTILGNGDISLIVDINSMIACSMNQKK